MKKSIILLSALVLLPVSVASAGDWRYQQNPYYEGNTITPGGYNIDQDRYNRLQLRDNVLNTLSSLKGETPTSNFAQNYANQQQQAYRNAMANQAGVPYENYICNGDYNCIQRYDMQRQYTNVMNNYSNALRNQHMTIDANVNHSGTINVNNYNRYRY